MLIVKIVIKKIEASGINFQAEICGAGYWTAFVPCGRSARFKTYSHSFDVYDKYYYIE